MKKYLNVKVNVMIMKKKYMKFIAKNVFFVIKFTMVNVLINVQFIQKILIINVKNVQVNNFYIKIIVLIIVQKEQELLENIVKNVIKFIITIIVIKVKIKIILMFYMNMKEFKF